MSGTMRASLVVTGDASGIIGELNRTSTHLDKAGVDVERLGSKLRSMKPAADTGTKSLIDGVTGAGRAMSSARTSADAFSRAIADQEGRFKSLRASVDPVWRAEQQFAATQKEVNRAVASGVVSQGEAAAVLKRLEAQYEVTAAAAVRMDRAQAGMGLAGKVSGAQIQNASYQIADFAVQVAAGTAASRALGMQLPQLLGAMGAIGAVAGAVVAVGVPLLSSFIDTTDAAEGFSAAIEELEGSLRAYKDAVEAGAADQLRQQFGAITPEIVQMAQELQQLRLREVLLDAADAAQTLSQRFEYAGFISTGAHELKDLLDINIDQAEQLQVKFRLIGRADTFQSQLAAINAVQDAILSTTGGIDNMTGAQLAFYEETLNAESALRAAEAASADTGSAISGAADEAGRLAGQAYDAAGALAQMAAAMDAARSAAFQSYQTAQARLATVGDPVARAGQLAVVEQRWATDDGGYSLIRSGNTGVLAQREAEAKSLAETAAEAEEAARDADAAYRKLLSGNRKTRGARGNGSRRKKGVRNASATRADRDYERLTSQISREIDKVAPSYDRDVAAAKKWRDEALAGLDETRAGYEAFAADVELIFQDKMSKAYEADLKRRDDWAAGVERGLQKLNDKSTSWADLSEGLFTNWAKGGEDAFVSLVKTGSASLDDLVDYTIEAFARMTYQATIQPLLNGLFTSAFDGIGSALGISLPSFSLPTAHTGGTGVMRTYSAGNRPRSDERLAMLRDGEKVFTPRMLENAGTMVSALAGAASQSGQTQMIDSRPVIQVVNNSSAQVDARVEEQSDGNGQRQFVLVMDDAVAGSMAVSGGKTQRSLRRQYGVRPKGVGR